MNTSISRSVRRLFARLGAPAVTGLRRVQSATVVCSLLLTASALTVRAQPEPGPELQPPAVLVPSPEGAQMQVPALKAAYLDCDRAANEHLLSLAEAMSCSQVGEALLIQGFNRDFDRLLAWWRSEKRMREGATVGPCASPNGCDPAPARAALLAERPAPR